AGARVAGVLARVAARPHLRARDHAVDVAAVAVDVVAVVARLRAVDRPVAAARPERVAAGRAAVVGAVVGPVVADLAGVDLAVAPRIGAHAIAPLPVVAAHLLAGTCPIAHAPLDLSRSTVGPAPGRAGALGRTRAAGRRLGRADRRRRHDPGRAAG